MKNDTNIIKFMPSEKLQAALEVRKQIEQLENKLKLILGGDIKDEVKPKRKMSKAGREAVSKAQRERHAKARLEKQARSEPVSA